MLTAADDSLENLVDISHIEITAHQQIPRPPVIAAKERMDIIHPRLSGRRIAQMAHVNLAYERNIALDLGRSRIGKQRLVDLRADIVENLLNGARTHSSFAEHIFRARRRINLQNSDPGAFLTAVMLLLHRLAQTYHRNPAFMFELFHLNIDSH